MPLADGQPTLFLIDRQFKMGLFKRGFALLDKIGPSLKEKRSNKPENLQILFAKFEVSNIILEKLLSWTSFANEHGSTKLSQ